MRPAGRPAGSSISFATRILLALVGSVGLLGAASLLMIEYERQRQVEWSVQRAAARAQRALGELERLRGADLARAAQRLTGSIRIAAALEAAIAEGAIDEFREHVRYELTLAEWKRGLVAFSDPGGRPVLTLIDGVATALDRPPAAQARKGDASAIAYQVVADHIFTVQTYPLLLFGREVGTLTLGSAVDDEAAAELGAVVESEICFVAAARCMAGATRQQNPPLAAAMAAAAQSEPPVFRSVAGRRVALVSRRLSGSDMATVIAVPLDEVLRPFDRIRSVERGAAVAALALALLLGLLLSKALTRPIRRLVSATERVRHGDIDFSVDLPSRDEFGRLGAAFNQMLEGLRLKERYRGVLDKVVSPRIAQELMKGDLRLGGETREVTTLFADIRGFTTLTESSPPEQVISSLNEWLEIAAAVIEDEGGVVDKYVGDEVMAVFGAPMAQADHAVRAVRAGLQLSEKTEALSRLRQARGDPPFSIGIGINTGPAVAGNTGSARRLNYTVLGTSVNIAARLCSNAQGGELLVSERTYAAVADLVDAMPQPPRTLKGFSRPVVTYAVRGLRAAAITLALLLAVPSLSSAQVFDLPTLAELGVHYVSPGGLVQLRPSVRIDFDFYAPQDEPAWHLGEHEPFASGRASLFLDLFVGRRVYALTELRVDRGQPARAGDLVAHVQQAFVRVTPKPGVDFNIEAGKFISPFGNYPRRAHTPADPLIRPPLPYDYRTVISQDVVPGVGDAMFDWKNRPPFRAAGLPVVWAVPYPIGITAAAGHRRLRLVAGVVNTAVSAAPSDWDSLDFSSPAGLSFVGHVNYEVMPELRIGASYHRGPYMRPTVADARGPLSIPRQNQDLVGLEAAFTRGHVAIRGELLFDRWEVFRAAGDPQDVSYYAETRVVLAPGLFAAARYGAIHFLDLVRSTGAEDRWDYDVRRLQLGAGYRLGRTTELRAEYMINRTLGRTDPRDNLLSLQTTWVF